LREKKWADCVSLLHGPRRADISMSALLRPGPMPRTADLMSVAITATRLVILQEIAALNAKTVALLQDPGHLAVVTATIADPFPEIVETQDVDLLQEGAVATAVTDTAADLVPQGTEGAVEIVEVHLPEGADQAGAVKGTGVVSRVDN